MTWSPDWRKEGQEPDYRFTLANERTFLAWIRTAMAFIAGGILLVQFSGGLQPKSIVVGLALSLCAVAATASALSYARWKANEIAMRHSDPLPASIIFPTLSIAVFMLALAVGLVIL